MKRSKLNLLGKLSFITFFAMVLASSQVRAAGFNELASGFVFHFVNYIEWPNSFEHDLIIAVYNDTDMVAQIQTKLSGKSIRGHTPKVISFEGSELPSGSDVVIFIGKGTSDATQALAQSSGKQVLIITDQDNLYDRGGHILLFLEGEKLRFSINSDHLKTSQLKASSLLLNLARSK